MADKTVNAPTADAFEEKVKALERAEAELARIRQRLEGVTEMARLAYWEHDIPNDIYTFNDQFYKILHTTAQEVGGYTMSSKEYAGRFIHPEDLAGMLPEMEKNIESGYSRPDRQIEHRVVYPDGSFGYVAVTFFLVTDSGGKPARAYGVTQDITERKLAEIALRDEMTRRRILVDQSKDGIIIVDQNARVVESNQQFATMIGYSMKELREFHIWDWDASFSKTELLELLKNIDEGGIHFETRHRRKDGTEIEVEISANGAEYRGQKLIFAVHRDVTRRKRAEREHQAHLKFFECMDRINLAMQAKDDVGQAMEAILEVILSTFSCDRAFLLYPCDPEAPSYRIPMECDVTEHPGISDRRFEIPMDTDSSEMLRTLRQSDGPAAFGQGNPNPLDGIIPKKYGIKSLMAMALYPKSDDPWAFGIQQCTYPRAWSKEEKQLFQEIGRRLGNMLTSLLAHRDLQKNEQFLASIVDNIPDMIFVKDAASMKFVRINRAGEKILGRPREELIGKDCFDLRPRKEAADIDLRERSVIEKGQLVDIPEEHTQSLKGDQKILHTKMIPLPDENGTPQYLLGISEDITELKTLQTQLLQAQKLEAIGAMSGGIAHDFNNVLQPMVGFCEMLQEDLPADSPLHVFVEGILKSALRARELVNRILAFSRRTERKKTSVKLQTVLKEVIKLARSIIPSTIEIRQDIQETCPAVLADATQIHQIAMNLMINGYHAMESGGELLIRLKETALGENDVANMPLQPGRYAVLSISDTGCGIDPAIIDKIFDPYFTTKPQDKGTGLGLSVVYGIVKEHQGHIAIASTPGEGTCADIYLPTGDRDQAVVTFTETAAAMPYATGSEHILLVDDEEMVLLPEKMMLERLGYQVTARASSIEALETFRSSPDLFDLVITDMTMPKMTGDLLARELGAIRPGVPVIICSGFNEKILPDAAKPDGVCDFLMKPVGISEMAKTVRRVLDANGIE